MKANVTIEIAPPEAASVAKVTIDGTAAADKIGEITLEKGKKSVKVAVTATGFRSVDQKIDVDGDITVKIEMIKKPVSTTPNLPRPKTPKPKPKPKAGGGLIDI